MNELGYPDENELRLIRNWDINDFPNLIEFVEERWSYPDYIDRKIIKSVTGYVLEWTLITGGWSGNESLINALLGNKNFEIFWYYEWTRGGRHVFRIDPENVGYKLVRDYCRDNNVSRQYISQSKDKFLYYRLSKNKVFIKKKL